jgi:hypothetical protein
VIADAIGCVNRGRQAIIIPIIILKIGEQIRHSGGGSAMTAIGSTIPFVGGLRVLDRERIIATAGYNRWLVPPAALCIHLCIGMAYGFSVFWLPLSRALSPQTQACPDLTLLGELFTTTCNWRVASLGWMYTLFFVLLGIAAAVWGGWLERAGPR